MKFSQIAGSLLAATTLLVSSLPAQAGPFDNQAGGVFKPVTSKVKPAAVGNVIPKKSGVNSVQQSIGNSEIKGLGGDHESWVDTKVLSKDPRALCSDVGLGNDTRTSSIKIAQSTSQTSRSSSATASKGGGGGGVGVNIFGIGVGANGSGGKQSSQRTRNSDSSRSNRRQQVNTSSSTVVKGRNCDAFVESAAARDMNYQDNVTRRYEIKTNRRGQQVNQLLTK